MLVEEKEWPKRQLQIECKELSDQLLWSFPLNKEVIYLSPMKMNEWVALLMRSYNKQVVELIQTLPTIDRFFYQAKVNRFKQLSIWCIRKENSQAILDQLKTYRHIQLEPLERNCTHMDSLQDNRPTVKPINQLNKAVHMSQDFMNPLAENYPVHADH